MRRRSKLKNKVWNSSYYRHKVFLKRAHKQVEYVTVLFTATTRLHSERILPVSPEILHTKCDELAFLSTIFFPSLMV